MNVYECINEKPEENYFFFVYENKTAKATHHTMTMFEEISRSVMNHVIFSG